MHIAVIGAGYVGLVVAACLAELGHEVHLVESDRAKLALLREGGCPIYEPGLVELLERARSRIQFSGDIARAVANAKACFVCVGTPEAADGSADLSAIESVLAGIGQAVAGPMVVILKSTVPVGAHRLARRILDEVAAHPCDIVSNPEFLREGSAVNDFLQPDRVVLGVPNARAEKVMRAVYAPLVERARTRLIVMDNASAELAKYAANAMLATRISFINEIAELCEATGADVTRVRQAIAHDPRIGAHFLDAGLGYGGCCFPKDVHALIHTARALSKPLEIVSAADRVNAAQRQRVVSRVQAHFGQRLSGLSIALWGLAFKPHTDDVRDAPALTLAKQLTALGARVVAFDPHARESARAELGDLVSFAPDAYTALGGRDALVIATEWPEFARADLNRVKSLLRSPVIFDGRNLWDPERLEALGFHYYSVGRRATTPGAATAQQFQAVACGGEP